jgi:hypothetical protein
MNDMRNPSAAGKSVYPEDVARALGWFSIGLGLAEALMPSTVSRASGIKGSETLVRNYGAREIANGVGILTADDPTPWVWARVAGDVMDISTLAARGAGRGSALAFLAVAGVTALDIVCASKLKAKKARLRAAPKRDYSDRSGLPEPAQQMRGAAIRELKRAVPER